MRAFTKLYQYLEKRLDIIWVLQVKRGIDLHSLYQSIPIPLSSSCIPSSTLSAT